MIYGYSNQVKYLKQLTLAEGWQDFVNSYYDKEKVYNSILASAIRIVNGDIFYTRDATEGRFHSNVTNMKRGLRQYLRVNGKPLANIDISNSQPYLSTIILTYPAKVSGQVQAREAGCHRENPCTRVPLRSNRACVPSCHWHQSPWSSLCPSWGRLDGMGYSQAQEITSRCQRTDVCCGRSFFRLPLGT